MTIISPLAKDRLENSFAFLQDSEGCPVPHHNYSEQCQQRASGSKDPRALKCPFPHTIHSHSFHRGSLACANIHNTCLCKAIHIRLFFFFFRIVQLFVHRTLYILQSGSPMIFAFFMAKNPLIYDFTAIKSHSF